ncbi:MAG TPA: energy transducer TonB [Chitinophagaceae bacterium]|nr:energy transducer TonB [Chitinophagaceae bacterium]
MRKNRFKNTALVVLLFISGYCFSQNIQVAADSNFVNPDSVYSAVDIPAEHPKGKDARIKFLEKNIDAAIAIKNGAPAGTYKVLITCIIDTAGKIIAMVPVTHHGYGMEKETMRVLKNMPAFKPAIKNGVIVKSKISFPVTFMSRSAN